MPQVGLTQNPSTGKIERKHASVMRTLLSQAQDTQQLFLEIKGGLRIFEGSSDYNQAKYRIVKAGFMFSP